MTARNSYPLDIEGLEDCPKTDPDFAGFKWARPSLSHLRRLMRHVYENPIEAQGISHRMDSLGRMLTFFTAIGNEARRDMFKKYRPSVIARIIKQHLDRISAKLDN